MAPAAATLPGPRGVGAIAMQEQTGGLHDSVTVGVFSAVTLRAEVLTRVLAFLGESRTVVM
jgi:hypothetical protein